VITPDLTPTNFGTFLTSQGYNNYINPAFIPARAQQGYSPFLPTAQVINSEVEITDFHFGAPLQSTTPPPTVAQLANLSNDTYSKNPGGTSGYKLLTTLNYGNGLSANIYGSPDNSQIVLAFKGTDPNNDKNLLADAALGAGVNSALLGAYVADAEQSLQTLSAGNRDVHITLTGHSLGGAVAQLLGKATGADTVVFDSPGIAGLYPLYAAQLAPLPHSGVGASTPTIGSLGTKFRLSERSLAR